MGGSGRNALRAVKAELLESLKSLDTVHQFQIIFYNERPVVFNPTARPAGWPSPPREQGARRPVHRLDHRRRRHRPRRGPQAGHPAPARRDLLSHRRDDPKLTPAQLETIRRLAAGILINAIEFGPGPKPAGASFLAELARQNGGGYTYVDLSQRK